MRKCLISAIILIAYAAILIKVMVFKDIPLIRVGSLMLNFGGTTTGHEANFIPFKTILPYLFGYKGLIIAGINLIGNIALLVPLGFLAPLVWQNMTWKKSLVLGVAAGLAIEVMQTVLNVGIFDIDDVILNALGVMVGYFAFAVLSKWLREKKYKNIIIAVLMVMAIGSASFYAFYPKGEPVNPMGVPQSGDLCGGTGGNGEILSLEKDTIVMKRKDGTSQIIHLIDIATIRTSASSSSQSDLKIGDRITIVGGPNLDGSFTASTIVVCSVPGPEAQSER